MGGLQNVVAVRFEQIVEQLHVEVVVLNHENRLIQRAHNDPLSAADLTVILEWLRNR